MKADEILLETALLYFKEALIAQEFENCPSLIQAAKNLGASQGQIDEVIALSIKGNKVISQNGASQNKNRIFSLKEGK